MEAKEEIKYKSSGTVRAICPETSDSLIEAKSFDEMRDKINEFLSSIKLDEGVDKYVAIVHVLECKRYNQ